jgi:hypothetical protein
MFDMLRLHCYVDGCRLYSYGGHCCNYRPPEAARGWQLITVYIPTKFLFFLKIYRNNISIMSVDSLLIFYVWGGFLKVALEDVWDLQQQLFQINNYKFDEIEWYYDGAKLEVPQELKDEFKIKNLPNTNFIEVIEEKIDLDAIILKHEEEWSKARQKWAQKVKEIENLFNEGTKNDL